jgi:TPR repeat protein
MSAEQGNVDAQFSLGAAYHDGDGVPRNYPEAAKWLLLAGERGKASAQALLGSLYTLSDTSWQPDYGEAARWFRKAADQGIVDAQVGLANLYYSGQGVQQSFADALTWYRKGSRSPAARFNLGIIYSKGDGVTQDHKEAAAWFRRAADDGVAQAQFNLARQYYEGQGVKQDFKEAAKWFEKAADQAHAPAQFQLATLYFEGKGVRQDFVRAHMWVDLAAASAASEELPERIQLRDTIVAKMSPAQITESQRLKQAWRPAAVR